MARLTRNSYKRKIILFAVFVFISIALISTGFAAWVMSNDAKVDANGNVTVGVVADSSLDITFNKTDLEAFKFQFEPAKGDNTGRVRLEKVTTENPTPAHEALSFKIEGSITNPDILAKLSIKIELPAGIQKAITENYIVAPECATKVVEISVDETGKFEYVIEFKWGSAFNGINPSLFFDGDTLDEDGNIIDGDTTGSNEDTYPDDKVKEILENLRAYAYGYYTEFNEEGTNRAEVIKNHADEKDMPKFKVTIIAEAN